MRNHAVARRVSPIATSLRMACDHGDGSRTLVFECGCRVYEAPWLREAEVCTEHSEWPIEAQLVRYLR